MWIRWTRPLQRGSEDPERRRCIRAGKVSKGSAGYYISGSVERELPCRESICWRRASRCSGSIRPRRACSPATSWSPQRTGGYADWRLAKQTGVEFHALNAAVTAGIHDVKKLRIGMYQRYSGGNIDEGWTRWMLEQFSFPVGTGAGCGDQEGRSERQIRCDSCFRKILRR